MHKRISLARWVDTLQSNGQYAFSRSEALSALKISKTAFKYALLRLVAKSRIVIPRRGFYIVVPLEYKNSGSPPASWFIDGLMKFSQHPYYVGLLSAAAIHGAAHQQPQEFHVITDTPMRPANAGRNRIRFFLKSHLDKTQVSEVKTETGSMRVSTPEATALDIIRYAKRVGGLGNVTTVLKELSDRINPQLIIFAADKERELAVVQRLGYLLERFGSSNKSLEHLARWLNKKRVSLAPLRPERNSNAVKKDMRWKLIINENVEADE
ncbi:MAG: type IV toxin-antitoxin system AbiEi family antitoxin [Elusimicrobia bacterium]|nr:type IV toxin-antitoxin system AbiEi family antitoxin [Elusimicrobiota bacterium]